jgi:hypothetical protein
MQEEKEAELRMEGEIADQGYQQPPQMSYY